MRLAGLEENKKVSVALLQNRKFFFFSLSRVAARL